MPALDPPINRFWRYVSLNDVTGCWEWTRSLSSGYGQLEDRGKKLYAHIFAYERFIEKVPVGLELDHLCRNRKCANPAHLQPVTHKENIRRGYAIRTHCPRGHVYDEKNTSWYQGSRGCRECNRVKARANYAKRRSAVA